MKIKRLLGWAEHFGDLPGDLNGTIETFREHRTAVDRHYAVRARGGKADFEDFVRAAAGVQHHPSAAFAVRVEEVSDRGIEAGALQCLDNKTVLPRSIALAIPVLHGAASAYTEMRADRRDAFWARGFDLD